MVREEEALDLDGGFFVSLLLSFFAICFNGRLQQQQQREEPLPGSRRELTGCVCSACPAGFKAAARCCCTSILANAQLTAALRGAPCSSALGVLLRAQSFARESPG